MLQAALSLALFLQAPDGFPVEDRFTNADTACQVLSGELVDDPHDRGVVLQWCMRRTHASSRGRKVASRIDGSWIHDRDRPAAKPMYMWGVRSGRIDPGGCEHDRYDPEVRRPSSAKKLAQNWPFQNPPLPDWKRKRWLRSPHDMERFGTRGPHDTNVTVAREVLPGCWSPEALDRYDVNVTVTVKRAAKICATYGCRNTSAIKAHW